MAKKKEIETTTVVEVVETPEIEETTTVVEVVVPSDEDKILGEEETIKEVKVIDYTSLKRRYRVQNVLKNNVYELHGQAIGAILGSNDDAKKALREGAKKVELTKFDPKEEKTITTHIIEVIK